MKITIKKIKNYNFGKGVVVEEAFFLNYWDKYNNLVDTFYAGPNREKAEEMKQGILNYRNKITL